MTGGNRTTGDAGSGFSRQGRIDKHVENAEFVGFVRRVLRAHAKRVGDGDVEALADLVTLAAVLDTAIADAVKGLRDFGYSWADIARPLGITRQAAQQRWGDQ